MSKWKHRPKGQQPVNKNYKHVDNSKKRNKYLKERRESRQKQKATVYGNYITTPKHLWEHIMYGGDRQDYFSNVITQAERNLFKMYPTGGSFSIGGSHYWAFKWVSTQSNSFIMQKKTKKRRHYFNKDEWRDMIAYIRKYPIYNIILCKQKVTDDIWNANLKSYNELYGINQYATKNLDKTFVNGFSREELERIYFPKLYEKEKQFIIDAGCTFIENVEFNIIRAPRYNGDKEQIITMEGWKFRINRNEKELNAVANAEYSGKYKNNKSGKKTFIQRIKNMCNF